LKKGPAELTGPFYTQSRSVTAPIKLRAVFILLGLRRCTNENTSETFAMREILGHV